ncbi:MAG: YqgE/AlgH family protein [Alcanivoracaceae bacterium]|nr:YqgE/AlgH family protein [Alcanivoracaceae bacterium]
MNTDSLKHQLLIAMPQLEDPNFHHSVTYLIEHNDEGAMGLTINRGVEATLHDVLEDLEIELEKPLSSRHTVVVGGPVQPAAGFILHPPTGTTYDSTVAIADDLWLTTSQDILEAIAAGEGPETSLLALGYAGWGPGQLEEEMAQNAWLSAPVSNTDIFFEVPLADRWHVAASRLGVDLNLISTGVGHS